MDEFTGMRRLGRNILNTVFFQSLPFAEIQQQTQEGLLVNLAVIPAGGLAVIMTLQGMRTVGLPDLTEKSLRQSTQTHINSYFSWRNDPYHADKLEAWKEQLKATLS